VKRYASTSSTKHSFLSTAKRQAKRSFVILHFAVLVAAVSALASDRFATFARAAEPAAKTAAIKTAAVTPTATPSPAAPANAPSANRPVVSPNSIDDTAVIATIDEQIRKGWADAKITPSAAATDGEWCRRVYLDILGRVPSIDELAQFAADKSPRRKLTLVDRLLETEPYVDEYVRNWTNIWTNLLIGRSGGDDRRSLVDRGGMQKYLRESFAKNKPYDVLVGELVSARGANKPGEDGFNGAVNFVLDNLQENATTATAKTSRLFLGLQVQCTQCHNHPFNDWKQDQFWGMNAFFRQAKALRTFKGRDIEMVRLDDEDFPGESGKDPKQAEIFYEERTGNLRASWPTFVDGTKIDPSGYSDEVNRRAELAKLIVRSEYLGKSIVNRMWAHFLGYGFTKPLDDMGPHNSASHPELLDKLGHDFSGAGHDLKRLIRWIVLSEPYALSSRLGPKNKQDDPALGEKPLFSHFYLRQMRAEELYQSLLVATEAHNTRGGDLKEKALDDWLKQFTIAFGTDEGDETTTFNGTIPQTLMMMNGDLIATATKAEPGSFLHKVANTNKKPAAKIDHLYMAALARKPSANELKMANELLAARGGDTVAALQDVWWALLNSNEFILNH